MEISIDTNIPLPISIIIILIICIVFMYFRDILKGIEFELDKLYRKISRMDNHLDKIEKQINDIQSKKNKT